VIVVRHNYISARDRQSRGKGKPPKLAAVGRALAHVKYIQHRPGEDRTEGGREFFDDTEEGLDSKDLRKAIKELKDSRVVVHKITLAPEINPGDKKQFTRDVMEQLGREKGLDLKWMAVEHDNTDHHHIHVVVLGKDKNGTDVRIDRKDYDKIKEYGDRYLERWHPLELERAREEREQRERERIDARRKEREAERDQRIREGLELPFIHKKIVREMLEPYDEWKKKQAAKELEPAKDESKEEIEKPYFQDTIQAAGKEWTKQNTLKELRDLNEYLWDNYDERLPLEQYKKLVGWMKEKERLGEREPGKSEEKKEAPGIATEDKKDKNSFEHKGQKYSKDDSYEKLTGLSRQLAEADKKDRLSVDDYQKLRGWIENADRARWSGVLEKQMDIAKTQHWQGKARAGDPNNFRYTDPVQQELMANPVVGLYLQGASIAAQLVKWIPLDDRNRDYNKEALEHLEELKRNKLQEYSEPGRDQERRQQDLEAIENLNKAIELNKETRAKEAEEKKKKERKSPDPFAFDEWGRY
jgi:hypothetical protein